MRWARRGRALTTLDGRSGRCAPARASWPVEDRAAGAGRHHGRRVERGLGRPRGASRSRPRTGTRSRIRRGRQGARACTRRRRTGSSAAPTPRRRRWRSRASRTCWSKIGAGTVRPGARRRGAAKRERPVQHGACAPRGWTRCWARPWPRTMRRASCQALGFVVDDGAAGNLGGADLAQRRDPRGRPHRGGRAPPGARRHRRRRFRRRAGWRRRLTRAQRRERQVRDVLVGAGLQREHQLRVRGAAGTAPTAPACALAEPVGGRSGRPARRRWCSRDCCERCETNLRQRPPGRRAVRDRPCVRSRRAAVRPSAAPGPSLQRVAAIRVTGRKIPRPRTSSTARALVEVLSRRSTWEPRGVETSSVPSRPASREGGRRLRGRRRDRLPGRAAPGPGGGASA